MKGKPAGHVRLGDHELIVDGEEFPWLIARDVEVTETGHSPVPWLVHVKIFPFAAGDTGDRLSFTCPPKAAPVIGDRPFPWYISQDGYQIQADRHQTALTLAFPAKSFEDVRTPKAPA